MELKVKINDKWYEVTSIKYKGDDNTIYKVNPFNIQDVMFDNADYSYNELTHLSCDDIERAASANSTTPTDNGATLTEQDTQLCADNERIAALEQQLTRLTNTLGVEYTCTGEIRSRRLDELEKDAAYLKEMLVKNDTIMLGQSTRISELEELLRSVVRVLDIEKTEAKTEEDEVISCGYSSNTLAEIKKRLELIDDELRRCARMYPKHDDYIEWLMQATDITPHSIKDSDGNINNFWVSKPIEEHSKRLAALEQRIDALFERYVAEDEQQVKEAMQRHMESVNYEYTPAKVIDWEQRRYEIAKTLFTNYAFSSNKPEKKAIEKAGQLIEQLKKQKQ
jgi:hypothetical protein